MLIAAIWYPIHYTWFLLKRYWFLEKQSFVVYRKPSYDDLMGVHEILEWSYSNEILFIFIAVISTLKTCLWIRPLMLSTARNIKFSLSVKSLNFVMFVESMWTNTRENNKNSFKIMVTVRLLVLDPLCNLDENGAMIIPVRKAIWWQKRRTRSKINMPVNNNNPTGDPFVPYNIWLWNFWKEFVEN